MSAPLPTTTQPITTQPSRRRFAGMVLSGAALLLAGCGRKPSRVLPDPADGPDALLFPHNYPNNKADPPGTVPPSAATIPPAPPPEDTTSSVPSPAQPEPAKQVYPKIIRPEDLQPGGSLLGTGTWPSSNP